MKRRGNSLLRRAEAILVALVVILTSISIPQTVDATVTNTEVSNENLKYITGLTNTSFNVNGYYNSNWIMITYANRGYLTQMKVDGASPVNLAGLTSGESVTISGLQVTQNLSFVNAGRFVKVSYTVTNPGTESKTFSLGSCADVQIADNDGATIRTTSTGIRMADTSVTHAQYNLVARNSYGVTDVDSLWFGPFRGTNLYNNYTFTDVDSSANTEATTGPYAGYYTTDSVTGKKTAISSVDSAIGFAWNDRPIAAGGTQTYSVLFGVGGDATPPQVDVSNDINLNLSSVHRGEPVDVTANITDSVGRTDYLFYALDDGDAGLLNTSAGTGARNTVTGQFVVPQTWEDDTLHTISLWVMNDQGAMSDTKKVSVYINGDESSIVQEATQYTISYDSGGASGTSPASAQAYEKSHITLPTSPYTVPAGKVFGGWNDGKSVYLPGEDYVMSSANTTLTAVWLSAGIVNYCIDYYQKNVDGSKYVKVDTTVKSVAASTPVSLAEDDIKSYIGFTENAAERVASGTANSSSTLHLKVYYDRNNVTVTFMNGSTAVGTATTKYGGTVSLPADLSAEYKTFGGWYTGTSGTGVKILNTSPVKPADGSSMIVYGNLIPNPITLTKSSYAFTYGQETSVRRRIEIGCNSEFNSRLLSTRLRSTICDCAYMPE